MKRDKGVFLWWFIVLLGRVLVCRAASSNEERCYYHRGRPILSMLTKQIAASSVVLPLYGNVYPNGFYYVHINIGQPAKPYFLDPDTGSDLTWLQCDAPCIRCTNAPHPLYKPSNDLVPCKDPLCISLQSDDHKCESPEQCDYEVDYADGGSSYGVLVRDIVALNFTSGPRDGPRLAIGCGYDQIPGSSCHPLDGVLGLGKGKASIVSQLHDHGLTRNVIGHCLSARGGGYIFFGDGLYDPSRIVWTPMSRDSSKYYSPGPAELFFGGKMIGIKNLLVIFDSGSSYTYFASQPYEALISMLRKELAGTSLRDAAEDVTLPLCWKGKKPFKSVRDVRKYFKPLALSFGSGGKPDTQFEIAPESYLIISLQGNACLGILNGTEIGFHDFNIVGDISMQDKMVIYDNEKQIIGWAPTNCDRFPKGNAVAS
ncbi:hypothetical protein Ancab_024368 [Ancistrocladus abbreviatus]